MNAFGRCSNLKHTSKATKADYGISSHHLLLVVLEHTVNTTSTDQLACIFCTCIRWNNSPNQQVAVACIHHSKRDTGRPRTADMQTVNKAVFALLRIRYKASLNVWLVEFFLCTLGFIFYMLSSLPFFRALDCQVEQPIRVIFLTDRLCHWFNMPD